MAVSFSELLKKWRIKQRLMQKQAADRLRVSTRTYQNWEEAINVPNALARAEIQRRMQENPE